MPQDKTSQDNVNTIRKLFEFFNKNDLNNLNACEEHVASDVQLHDPAVPNAKAGIQTLKQAESTYIKALPNKKTKIETIFGSGDQVAVNWTCSGTNKGSYQGVPATNKEIKTSGTTIYRLKNGKVTEIWQNWDSLGLMEQLGEVRTAHAHH